MQTILITCDSCDKELDTLETFKKNVLIHIEPGIKLTNIDLCVTCWERLLRRANPKNWGSDARRAC